MLTEPELKAYSEARPKSKTFSLTIGIEEESFFDMVHNELLCQFRGVLKDIICAPSLEECELVFQGTLISGDKYVDALSTICGLTKMTPEVGEELQFSMELRDVKVYGDITVVEQFLLTTLVSFTHEARSAILIAYHELSQLRGQVETISQQVALLAEDSNAQKIYHTTHIQPMQQAVLILAEEAGLTPQDVYPTSFHKVQ